MIFPSVNFSLQIVFIVIHSPADHYVLQMLKQILLLVACVAVSMALPNNYNNKQRIPDMEERIKIKNNEMKGQNNYNKLRILVPDLEEGPNHKYTEMKEQNSHDEQIRSALMERQIYKRMLMKRQVSYVPFPYKHN